MTSYHHEPSLTPTNRCGYGLIPCTPGEHRVYDLPLVFLGMFICPFRGCLVLTYAYFETNQQWVSIDNIPIVGIGLVGIIQYNYCKPSEQLQWTIKYQLLTLNQAFASHKWTTMNQPIHHNPYNHTLLITRGKNYWPLLTIIMNHHKLIIIK